MLTNTTRGSNTHPDNIDRPRDEMRDYIVITAYPEIPAKLRLEGREVAEAWRSEVYRENLSDLADEIRTQVLSRHGGCIVADGGKHNADIIVRTTAAGLEALKEIDAIGRISECIDFKNLSLQPDGFSNVPPGVCWTRPRPE